MHASAEGAVKAPLMGWALGHLETSSGWTPARPEAVARSAGAAAVDGGVGGIGVGVLGVGVLGVGVFRVGVFGVGELVVLGASARVGAVAHAARRSRAERSIC